MIVVVCVFACACGVFSVAGCFSDVGSQTIKFVIKNEQEASQNTIYHENRTVSTIGKLNIVCIRDEVN